MEDEEPPLKHHWQCVFDEFANSEPSEVLDRKRLLFPPLENQAQDSWELRQRLVEWAPTTSMRLPRIPMMRLPRFPPCVRRMVDLAQLC